MPVELSVIEVTSAPVELTITETSIELEQAHFQVILESASTPGPQGPPGAGGVVTADYLVGTAQAGLTSEIVVGTTPNGELGGTWGAITVDALHSGSTHAAVQAAAEATADGALASHDGAADPHTGYRLESAAIVSADIQDGTIAVGDLAFDPATQVELDAHLNDTSDAHDASAVSFTPAGTIAATDVQAAIEEVAAEAGATGAPTTADYLVGTAQAGLSAEIVVGASPGGELGGTWASPTVDASHSGSTHAAVQAAAEATAASALTTHIADTTAIHGIADTSALVVDGDAAGGVLGGTYPNPSFAADMATQAELDAHVNDTSAAHAASAISADSTTLVGTGTTVQAVLEELDDAIAAGGAPTTVDYLVGTATGALSAEIVVGTSPGGELGGTWASPTVDATHSGSTHAAVQAAAEATAAAALAAHTGDATDAHDASAISVVSTTLSGTGTDVQASLEELDNLLDDHSARHEIGGDDELDISPLMISPGDDGEVLRTSAGVATWAGFSGAAAAITVDSTTLSGTGANVQASLEEIDNLLDAHASRHNDGGADEINLTGLGGVPAALTTHEADTTVVHGIADTSALALTANHPSNATFNDHSARHENGGADEISIAGLDGTPVELTNHLNDAADAHDASAISIIDSAGDFTATDVEGALAELQSYDEASATVIDGSGPVVEDSFGWSGAGGSPSLIQALTDYVQVTLWTMDGAGFVTDVVLNLDGNGPGSGTGLMKAVIYEDSGGVPGVLLGVSSEVSITDGQAQGDVTFSFATPIPLSAADYFVGLHGGTNADNIRFLSDATIGKTRLYDLDAYAGGPADPFGTADGSDANAVLSIVNYIDWPLFVAGGGSGAPTTVDYLVGTASGGLSAEIVVGTTPGGELGGTWASPTVDALHSGSTHAAVQAAAEATAAAALAAYLTESLILHMEVFA